VNFRRVRGRTFIVPIGGASLAGDGTLDATKQGNIQSAANTLVASAAATVQLVIWSRPFPGDPNNGGSFARDGSSHPVKSALVRDKVAMLRSRRD
jgi:hypothetical protein